MATYFCDGIRQVTVLNGVARLEFCRLQSTNPPGSSGDAQPLTELIVALPAPGILQVLSLLEQIRDQLVNDRVLQSTAREAHSKAEPNRSPNFPETPGKGPED